MEKWTEYRKGVIPKGKYSGKLSYKEGMKPIIELKSWYGGEIINYIKIEFNQAYSVRVFEEHSALCDIFEGSMRFWDDNCDAVIYEVDNGDYANNIKKASGNRLERKRIYQYVIFTLNYYYEIIADSEPTITLMEDKEDKRKRFYYQDSYEQEKVDMIFKHLEDLIYMSKNGGYYTTYVELKEGEYCYKYLLGDGLELIDKENKNICIDDENYWSVLTIDKDGVVYKEIESYATLLEYGIFHKMMEVVPDKEESKIFNADKDKQAVCMLSFNEIKGLHIATVAWYKPDGELYRFTENDFGSYEESDDDKVMLRFWLDITEIDETDFGNWTVRTFLDGEMIKEDSIIISGNSMNKIDTKC